MLETDPDFIKKAIELKSCNALLLKVNQIGTLTESIQAAKDAFAAGWGMYKLKVRCFATASSPHHKSQAFFAGTS